MWAGLAAVALAFVVIVILGYIRDWPWTGLGASELNGEKQPAKTLWDWLDLLIVPAILAAGGLWFNAQQRERDQQTASERAQDDALQAYLNGMAELLTSQDKDQPMRRTHNLGTVARARTLTVLPSLDGDRKGRVLQFLYESGLILKDPLVLSLSRADLRNASLSNTSLAGANLSGAKLDSADLRGVFLDGADLSFCSLKGALLRETQAVTAVELFSADLSGANLQEAELPRANLNMATLTNADLSSVHLRQARLRSANLHNAELRYSELREADLHDAQGITNEEIERQAFSLEGATMPNGQKYEDWLKAR
jgi:uncharacterized protein YjbI with pentapeptide repeats